MQWKDLPESLRTEEGTVGFLMGVGFMELVVLIVVIVTAIEKCM